MPDPRDKRVELILQQLEELPTLPAVAVRVLQVTGDDHSSAADVVRLIGSDPALSARILQLTRRADKAVREEIRDIDRAVMLLGFDAVRNAVLAISVFQAMGQPAVAQDGSPRAFSREAFWKHCLAVACCAELLAEQAAPQSGVTPSEAFICGLLHDLGKLALDVALPKSYARVVEAAKLLHGDVADIERKIIGVDHLIAGKRLAERWQLPSAIRDAAWLHGQPPEALPAAVHTKIVNLITLADLLVRQQHLGYSGNYSFSISRESLLDATGLNARQVEAALGALVQRMEPRSEALGLGQTTSDMLYRDALEQANQELNRVSVQLSAKTRRLSERTQFFDTLEQFQAGLRPDASPQQVLSAIASAAAGTLQVDRTAAFSLAPGQDYAEAILCDDEGGVLESAFVELPGMAELTDAEPLTEDDFRQAREQLGVEVAVPSPLLSAPSPAKVMGLAAVPSTQGPVLAAGDNIEWLTGELSPKLPHERRYWICLQADGACIGGIVWGGTPAELERLRPYAQELSALGHGWALALRMAQVREEARNLAEELASANRRLHQAQDAVLRSRSLSTIGELAAGAAHEMNNPLAVISGRSQLLARILPDEKQQASARLIHEQSDRLSDIITEMMAFAKPQPPSVKICGLESLVLTAIAASKARTEPADREFDVVVGEVPPVIVDAGQVSGALAELIDNAVLATDARKGKIVIRSGHDPWSGNVVVTLEDNGCGMDEATLKRAFDPFFSSKRAGRRRGLGLSKALRWIEAAQGSIRLESEPGKGSRAIVLLPAADVAAIKETTAFRRINESTPRLAESPAEQKKQ